MGGLDCAGCRQRDAIIEELKAKIATLDQPSAADPPARWFQVVGLPITMLTGAEAAHWLAISERTLYEWTKTGRIVAVRLGIGAKRGRGLCRGASCSRT